MAAMIAIKDGGLEGLWLWPDLNQLPQSTAGSRKVDGIAAKVLAQRPLPQQ
jgi:hypothetical protein